MRRAAVPGARRQLLEALLDDPRQRCGQLDVGPRNSIKRACDLAQVERIAGTDGVRLGHHMLRHTAAKQLAQQFGRAGTG